MPGKYKYSLLEYFLFLPFPLSPKKLRAELAGKTVLITGASYGIGESLAYMLADTRAHLLLVARTEEKLAEVKTRIEQRGGKATIYPTDLSKQEQVEQLTYTLLQIPGGIDIIVNNAGRSIRRSIKDSLGRYHDFTRTMAINYFGPVQLTLSLIPVVEKNKGHIINISALNVLLAPAPYWAAYQASKAAFDNWFRCAIPELNAWGIKTTAIYFPLVRTRMSAPTAAYSNVPAMSPEHAATIICRSIINKNRIYRPWWLFFGQLASLLFWRPWMALNTHYLKRKPLHAEGAK